MRAQLEALQKKIEEQLDLAGRANALWWKYQEGNDCLHHLEAAVGYAKEGLALSLKIDEAEAE